jgi:outer membrane protein assembly factor BamB
VVWNDKVYIGSFDGNLYCLSLSGKELWRFKMGAEIWSGDLSPVVSNNVIYFASMDGYVYAVDANTGKELWKVKTGKYGNWVQPIAYKNIVLQASRDEILFAFNRSGEELWRFKLGSLPGEPSVYKNTILIGDETGSFYAISLEGKELWRFQTGGKILGSCVFWNEKIFFGSFDCYLYSLNMSGGEVWRFATSSLVKVSLPPPNEAFKVEIKKSVDTEDSLEEKYRFNDVTVSADDFKNEYSTSSEYKRKSDYDTSLVIFEEDFLFSKTFNWL